MTTQPGSVTAFGLGSSVTFAEEAGPMEVTATLEARDEEKVVLAIRCTVGAWSLDFAETVRAAPEIGRAHV